MTRTWTRTGIALALATTCLGTRAYEVSTHAILSDLGVRMSQTYRDPATFTKLGLPGVTETVYTRTGETTTRNFSGIVQEGARWEDDQYALVACNHFFNPQANNRQGSGLMNLPDYLGLVALACGGVGIASPLWSLEDTGLAMDTNAPTNYHEFSMRSAYSALKTAMSGEDPATRLRNASLAMQSLGHIVHHIQDMAQPQHTRDEAHTHGVVPGFAAWPRGAYEDYTAGVNANIPGIVAANPYQQVSPARFNTARHFWYTPNSPIPFYVGMAEFSSQNFPSFRNALISVGGGLFGPPTSVRSALFLPLPDGKNQDGTNMEIRREFYLETLKSGVTLTGWRYYVRGDVIDGYSGVTQHNVKIGGVSMIGQIHEDGNVYDERHKILLPRAAAFSGGLIDYFFRGNISIAPLSGDQWTIRNTGQFALDGDVRIYYEDAAQRRWTVPAAPYRVSLQPNAQQQITNVVPEGTRKVIAVFEGQIGADGSRTTGYAHVTGDVVKAPPLPTIKTSVAAVTVPTSGQAVQVGISLSSAPQSSRDVQVTRTAGSTLMNASPTQLTFTPTNYATAQMVNVTGPANPSTAQAATFSVSSASIPTVTFTANQAAAPVAIPCGQAIQAKGGTGTYTASMDMGSTGGTVTVDFEAFTIKDSFEVRSKNSARTLLKSSGGMVSGFNSYPFNFQPGSLGSSLIEVQVTGNGDAATQWTIGVSCPGKPAPAISPRVSVGFGIGGVGACTGVNNVYRIDGGTPISVGKGAQTTVSLTPGLHTFDFVSMTVNPGCSEWGHPIYQDATGVHDIWSGAGTTGTPIYVCGVQGCTPGSGSPW
jgi:hypothetical protein